VDEKGLTTMACAQCVMLPTLPAQSGSSLYLAFPLSHTVGTVRTYLREHAIAFTALSAKTLVVPVTPALLQTFSRELRDLLSPVELRGTKTLILPETTVTPTIAQLLEVRDLHTLLAAVEGAWVAEMLRDARLTTHFQPIVSCTDPRSIFAYECLLRGKTTDGQIVPPGTIFHAAREAGFLFHLDRAARLTAVREATAHQITTPIFINFNPTAIYDPRNCLASTIKAIKDAAIPPERVVFEVVESDETADPDHLLHILAAYRDAGFRIALDDMGAGYSTLNLLSRLHPDFIKLDREIVRDIGADPYKAEIATKLLELAAVLNIDVIAEGVETETEWQWLRQHGARYVQGYLFARPASPPPPVVVRAFARQERA